MQVQSHREVIEKKRESKRESGGNFVELRGNREYGEFSWRAYLRHLLLLTSLIAYFVENSILGKRPFGRSLLLGNRLAEVKKASTRAVFIQPRESGARLAILTQFERGV